MHLTRVKLKSRIDAINFRVKLTLQKRMKLTVCKVGIEIIEAQIWSRMCSKFDHSAMRKISTTNGTKTDKKSNIFVVQN